MKCSSSFIPSRFSDGRQISAKLISAALGRTERFRQTETEKQTVNPEPARFAVYRQNQD